MMERPVCEEFFLFYAEVLVVKSNMQNCTMSFPKDHPYFCDFMTLLTWNILWQKCVVRIMIDLTYPQCQVKVRDTEKDSSDQCPHSNFRNSSWYQYDILDHDRIVGRERLGHWRRPVTVRVIWMFHERYVSFVLYIFKHKDKEKHQFVHILCNKKTRKNRQKRNDYRV